MTGPDLEGPVPGAAALQCAYDRSGHKRALPEAGEA